MMLRTEEREKESTAWRTISKLGRRYSNTYTFSNARPPSVMRSCSNIFSCKYPASPTFKLSVNNGKFYLDWNGRTSPVSRPPRDRRVISATGRLVRKTNATWSANGCFSRS